eukprot:scaffold6547_cov141-Skeletonema_dohrnii-CCMP3373.AAC.3
MISRYVQFGRLRGAELEVSWRDVNYELRRKPSVLRECGTLGHVCCSFVFLLALTALTLKEQQYCLDKSTPFDDEKLVGRDKDTMRISLAGRTAWEKRRIDCPYLGIASESKIEHSFVSWRLDDDDDNDNATPILMEILMKALMSRSRSIDDDEERCLRWRRDRSGAK